MTTLLAVYDSAGNCVGRCDAKCHDAHESDCGCICGGDNHGAGSTRAIANTRARGRKWLTAFAEKHNLNRDDLDEMVGVKVVQDPLFTDPTEDP